MIDTNFLEHVLIDKMNNINLNAFIEENKNLPSQGTKEWLDNKKYKIGGSEIATILNLNPYQSTKDLIGFHSNTKIFNNNIAIYWGRLFESVLQNKINSLLNCKINEFGSIPHKKHGNVAYSPDGVAVVHKSKLNKLIDVEDLNRFSLIVLFEFKCPYSRIPTGLIPDYYLPQPKLGLDIIKICDIAIFTEAIFRLCNIDDLDYNDKYNKSLHSKCSFTDTPLQLGYIIVYYDRIEITEDMDEDIIRRMELLCKISDYIENKYNNIYNKELDLYDLGQDSNYYVINTVMEYIFINSFFQTKTIELIDIELKKESVKTESLKLESEDKAVFGIIPYKLIKLYNNRVDRDGDDYLDSSIIEKIDDVISIIKSCDNKNFNERINIINNIK